METVRLERPTMRRAAEFLRAVRASRELHRGWVSPPSDRGTFERYVRSLRSNRRDGFLVLADSGDIAGVVNVSEIVRGSFQSAYLGYYAFEPFSGHGLLRLHRLEANIQPDNARSIGLVKSLVFRLEGFSPRYLKVGGRWRDHERWALLSENWRNRRSPDARPQRARVDVRGSPCTALERDVASVARGGL